MNPVTAVPAADPATMIAAMERRLSLMTDCADVHAALAGSAPGFVLIDVRGPVSYARGHVPGAVNLPHRAIDDDALKAFPADSLFVVYCAGPHCNGADQGALRLARLGRPVKVMMGGITGWQDEGFSLSA